MNSLLGRELAGSIYERYFVTPGTYAYQSSLGLTGTVTVATGTFMSDALEYRVCP